MEIYLQIGKANLKHNQLPHILLSIILLGLSPLIMGVKELDPARTALVLEMYVALICIILITPLFLPEQNRDLKDLVETKYISSVTVKLIRLLEAVMSLMLLIGLYILFLKYYNCSFPVMRYYFGTLAEAFFLGALGLCAYSIFNQIAIGYLFPVMYYILAFGGGKKLLGDFHLFSMSYGEYHQKINLAILGGILIIIGISYPYIARRWVPKLKRIMIR